MKHTHMNNQQKYIINQTKKYRIIKQEYFRNLKTEKNWGPLGPMGPKIILKNKSKKTQCISNLAKTLPYFCIKIHFLGGAGMGLNSII